MVIGVTDNISIWFCNELVLLLSMHAVHMIFKYPHNPLLPIMVLITYTGITIVMIIFLLYFAPPPLSTPLHRLIYVL